jgi:hypothetical protein
MKISDDGWIFCVAVLMLSLLCVRAEAQRVVFAHYMLTNQDYQADSDPTQEKKIAAYEREIEQARALGIDGFVLNAGGWLKQPYYVRYAAQMFEAAARLNDGFKLMFSADFCCGNTAVDAEDMMRRFAGDTRYGQVYFRYKGRFVLTTFAGDKLGVNTWKQIRDDLASGTHPSSATFPGVLAQVSGVPRNAPIKIFLVPAFFWGGELPDRAAIEHGWTEWKDVIDGSFYWGIAGVPGSGGALDPLDSADAYAAVAHARHRLYMAPVAVQFWGANANRYYEYSGGAGMRGMWMDAIERSRPDWVEIITWNDFIEGTYISPIDDPNRYPGANFLTSSGIPLGTRGYFHSHAAAGELMSYYIQWYKTGHQPAITDDAVYWFYRTQPAASDPGVPPVNNRYGPVRDVIYLTANLTAPATLRVESGGRVTSILLAAGSQDISAPFAPGEPPRFSLLRGERVVLQATGADPIEASPRYNNFYYSTGQMRSQKPGHPPSAASGVKSMGSGIKRFQ